MRIFFAVLFAISIAGSALAQQAATSIAEPTQIQVPRADSPGGSEPVPEHPVTPAQVHEMLQLSGAKQLTAQMMNTMLANLEKVFPPFTPKDVLDDIKSNLNKIDYETMAVSSYQKHISAEDAAQIIAFDKTPAGKRLIRAMPMITLEMEQSGEKAGREVVQQVIQQHMDEIKAAARKYQQDHSESPTVTMPN